LEDEEKDLEFLGCISLYDPLKKSALEAITRAESLGVQIKVLTGDGPEVSQTIGIQAGILQTHETVITGAEFMNAPYEIRKEMVEKFHVFARVSPEEKYEIIKLLEEKYTVGFLGEGINDAPALKVAHVGMVVENASDVAREAADIILLKQSLLVIVKGIEEGRRVFSNNIKYLKATLASNFGNFYAVVAASFLTSFLPMLPIQILLLNFLSDFPMMSIAADTVDAGELKTPRHYNIKDILKICLLLGAVSTVFEDIRFMFFAREYSYYFEVCKCIDDSIEEIVPVSVGNFLIFVCGIAKFLYPPNRKRKEDE
jgi:Mg2+-importing ATPase